LTRLNRLRAAPGARRAPRRARSANDFRPGRAAVNAGLPIPVDRKYSSSTKDR
jgi:hypothetical protein